MDTTRESTTWLFVIQAFFVASFKIYVYVYSKEPLESVSLSKAAICQLKSDCSHPESTLTDDKDVYYQGVTWTDKLGVHKDTAHTGSTDISICRLLVTVRSAVAGRNDQRLI